MYKVYYLIVLAVALTGCSTARPQPDFSKYKDAIQAYDHCLQGETVKYAKTDAQPIDIADAAAAKCEKGIFLAKQAIQEQAYVMAEPGSKVWVEMMKLADEKAGTLRENGSRRTISRVLDYRGKQ